MKDVVVSIGGGTGQLPLIEAARRMGLGVIVVDRDPRAPGAALADGHVVASTHDPEAVLRGLRPLLATRSPRAVATKSSGVPVWTCAYVARELGLPGMSPDVALDMVTKPGQRGLASKAGVRAPRGVAGSSLVEIEGADLGWPRVVKPSLTRVGKAGVSRVDDPIDFARAFEEALLSSGDRRVEVEEHVPGDDVVLAAQFRDSVLHPIALLDEACAFDSEGRVHGAGFALPSGHGAVVLGAVTRSAQRLTHELALGTGIGFFSFRVVPREEPCLIEVHFDLAGDFVADRLFGMATGYDPITETLRLLLGERLGPRPARVAATALRFLFLEDCLRPGAIEALHSEFEPEIGPLTCEPGGRVGYVPLRGTDAAAVAALARRVDELLGRPPAPRATWDPAPDWRGRARTA